MNMDSLSLTSYLVAAENRISTNLLHFNPVPWIVKLWRDLESTVARCWHTAHLKKSWVVKILAPS